MLYNKLLVIILFIYDLIFKTNFLYELRKWRKLDGASNEDLDYLISRKLELLKIQLLRNRYYSKFIYSGNDWFSKLPILDKKILKQFESFILNENTNKKYLISESSSGSSGVQSTIYLSKRESLSIIAAQTHLWTWSGYNPGDRLVQLGMTVNRSLVKKIKDILFRVLYLPAFELNDRIIEDNFKKIKKFNPSYFGGYASGLYTYAKFANLNGIKIEFNSVISWGDKLFPHYRKEIETAFGCKVYDTYGSTEGFVIAGQCEFMNYHILTPFVNFELIDSDLNEVEDGEIGKVIVTRFNSSVQPLVRYDLGDLAVKSKSKEKCSCGRNYPILEMIVGRNTDIIQTPSGNKLIVHFFTGIFEYFSEITQFRVIQDNNFTITIEVVHNLDDINWFLVSDKIKHIIWEKASEEFPFMWKRVSIIHPSPSGKPEIISSSLKF